MVLLSQSFMLNNSTSKTSNCFELKNVEGPTCTIQNINYYTKEKIISNTCNSETVGNNDELLLRKCAQG